MKSKASDNLSIAEKRRRHRLQSLTDLCNAQGPHRNQGPDKVARVAEAPIAEDLTERTARRQSARRHDERVPRRLLNP